MSTNFPNTQTQIDTGGDASRTNSGLSTQIIIKVNNAPVGAMQRLSVDQNRSLNRIKEIGTDGVIEIVPNGATEFQLEAERIVFDQLRLPEAFSRGFRFISAQRLPFDIDIIDFSGTDPNAEIGSEGTVTMTYRNCWFSRYSTPYAADNYIISETATLQCETAYVSSPADLGESGIPLGGGLRGIVGQTDDAGVEQAVNQGKRRGSLDASGLVSSIFERPTS